MGLSVRRSRRGRKVAGSWEGVRGLLGGKGSGLADMTRAGVPVPPGFYCYNRSLQRNFRTTGKFPEGLWDQMLAALKGYREKKPARNSVTRPIHCWFPAAQVPSFPCRHDEYHSKYRRLTRLWKE